MSDSAFTSFKDAADISGSYVKLIKDVVTTLNGSRSVVCSIINASPGRLLLETSEHAHGGFSVGAPAIIEAHALGAFGSQSDSWSVGTGTEGWVRYTYELPGYPAVSFTFNWDDPFLGENSSSVSRSAVQPQLVLMSTTGAGNEKADMRWTLIDVGVDLYGVIRDHWEQTGAQAGPLGWPTSSEADLPGVPGARFSRFDHGVVHYRDGHAFEVHGAIAEALASTPTTRGWLAGTDELSTPDGVGRFNHFHDESHGPGTDLDASIYWHPATGAHPVSGRIRKQWAAQGWEGGPLGYPVGDTLTTEVLGPVQEFQGGSLAEVAGPLAVEVMTEIFNLHGTPRVVHADRGTSMTSKTVAALLADLEVTRSHSRPRGLKR